MSKEELRRLEVIHKVIENRMKQKTAAGALSLSVRQVRRLKKKVKLYGDIVIVHGNRGKPSKRKFPDKFREVIMGIVERKYPDFGPTFASEKLEKIEKKKINRETLRQWMMEKGLWIPRKFKADNNIHKWRERKECFGEMVLLDGSIHDWLEGRGPKMTLMAYIDDATNRIFGRFYKTEDVFSAMDSLKRYIKKFGIPQSIYFDRHSIYKTTRQPNLDEGLKGEQAKTQFQKVLSILGVEDIHAYSPEAKGRVERLFNTLQDRLIKEMRLVNVCSIVEANKFLCSYIPEHNRRFSILPKYPKNLHKSIAKNLDINWVFAVRDERLISNDFTISWKNRTFLLKKPSMVLKKKHVIMLENLKGRIRIWFNGRALEFKEITKATLKQRRKQMQVLMETAELLKRKRRKPYKPKPDHPWRHMPFGNAVYK